MCLFLCSEIPFDSVVVTQWDLILFPLYANDLNTPHPPFCLSVRQSRDFRPTAQVTS